MSQKSYFKFFNPTFALREPALKLKMDSLQGYLIIFILKVGKVKASGYYNPTCRYMFPSRNIYCICLKLSGMVPS